MRVLKGKFSEERGEQVYRSVKKGLKDFEDFITHVRKFLERGGKIA